VTATAAIALITALLAAVPEVAGDVEKLIASFKAGNVPYVPLSPEVHAALDDLHARIVAAGIAARASG
jgi:hypothetical protein